MSKKRKTSTKTVAPRLSRRLLDKMVHDLSERLRGLRYEAEAMETIIAPNGKHIVIEYQTRQACSVLLKSLLNRVHEVEQLSLILARRSTLRPGTE